MKAAQYNTMLPRLRSLGRISRKSAFDERKLAVDLQHQRWSSTNTTSNPTETSELAYLKNPGKRPLLEMTIGQMLETAADRWPNRECLISLAQSQRLTYSQLLDRADRLAAGLIKLGLQRGDRIGVWGPNRIEWLVSYMAGSRAGLVVAGINPYYKEEELDYCLKKIEARAVLAPDTYRDQDYAQMLLRAREKLELFEHAIIWSEHHVQGARRLADVESLPSKKDIEAIKAEQIEISPYSGCNIQFTSGTTGRPKATLLSHRSLVNNSRQAVTRLDTDGRKICLNVPYFHAFGMIQGVSGPLHAGSTIVLESMTFNPVKSIEAIVGERCSVTFGTPTMWTNMIDVQTRSGVRIDTLYNGSIGGSPATPNLFRRIRESLKMDRIKSIYGLTETTAICNQSLPDEAHELTDTTVGYISDDVELKVVDENGKIVPFGTPGELLVRGYNTMIGYWNDEESTKKSFTEDGWLKTGDQYVLRKDGYGLIVGRIKDMLIRGGENIFPKEIEDFLETHPAIIEAHVFGVHDDVYGEEICACIRLKPDSKLRKDDLKEFAKGRIAKFKIPRYIEFCDEFPKTTSGKIQKFKLREELEAREVVPKRPKN